MTAAPTPLVFLGMLNGNRLYVKRDDLLPFCFGGNKARKAELFFREIDRGGYDAVVTYGSSHSNHCRVVANHCAARGLRCILISPEEASEETFNSRMMRLFGAEMICVPVEQVHDTIERTLAMLRGEGKMPYFIPGGGHGNPGTQAYVDCFGEIRDWSERTGVRFDYLFHASGTGTTQAGLVCGKLLASDPVQIVGVSIARKNPRGRDVVLDSVRSYLRETDADVGEEQIQAATVFPDDYTGDGYSACSDAVLGTIRRVMTEYGLPLDSTYTGKAFRGMELYLQERSVTGKTVLFLHTGGTPLFFDDLDKIGSIL